MKKRALPFAPRTLVFQLLLALSLLVAQTIAQAHVYSHLKGGTERSDFTGNSAGQLCGECLSSAPLLSAAGSPDSPRIVLTGTPCLAIVVVSTTRIEFSPTLGFRSRAPPELR